MKLTIRGVPISRSGCWSDAEIMCELAEHAVEKAADALVTRLARLGAYCYARGVEAKRRAVGPCLPTTAPTGCYVILRCQVHGDVVWLGTDAEDEQIDVAWRAHLAEEKPR